ncbi:hypothetical protein [Methylorubrum sp. GM97]|nr:hypothetical protein [Methylorubrum sp. GM97]
MASTRCRRVMTLYRLIPSYTAITRFVASGSASAFSTTSARFVA